LPGDGQKNNKNPRGPDFNVAPPGYEGHEVWYLLVVLWDTLEFFVVIHPNRNPGTTCKTYHRYKILLTVQNQDFI